MQIQPINSYSLNQQRPNFKSSIPVITMLGKNFESASIATTEELNVKFLRKIELLINNSLKRGIDAERDAFIDRLRSYIKTYITDFGGKISMYTCVDGGLKKDSLRPFAYMLTGFDKNNIEILRNDYKNAVKNARGFNTAELNIERDRYYAIGNFLVNSGYKNTKVANIEKPVFFACFEPKLNKKGEIMRTKEGEIKDFKISQVGFMPLNKFQNPKIEVGNK